MLTKQEYRVWALHSVGLSAKEIADKLTIEEATVRKHIDNGKKKVGKNKATEYAASFICQFYGENFDEFKRKVLASLLLCFLIFSINPTPQNTPMRNRRTQRTQTAYRPRAVKRESGNLYEIIPLAA